MVFLHPSIHSTLLLILHIHEMRDAQQSENYIVLTSIVIVNKNWVQTY